MAECTSTILLLTPKQVMFSQILFHINIIVSHTYIGNAQSCKLWACRDQYFGQLTSTIIRMIEIGIIYEFHKLCLEIVNGLQN